MIRKENLLLFQDRPELSRGLILLGFTQDKAFLFNKKELFEVNKENDSLSVIFSVSNNETIRAVCRDKNGKFWLGTDNGLRYYDPESDIYKR